MPVVCLSVLPLSSVARSSYFVIDSNGIHGRRDIFRVAFSSVMLSPPLPGQTRSFLVHRDRLDILKYSHSVGDDFMLDLVYEGRPPTPDTKEYMAQLRSVMYLCPVVQRRLKREEEEKQLRARGEGRARLFPVLR